MRAVVAERVHSAIDRAWTADEERRYLKSLSRREAFHMATADSGARRRLSEPRAVLACPHFHGPRRAGRHLRASLLAPAWSRPRALRGHASVCGRAGYRKLVITVRGSNAPALSFYRGLGFMECGRLSKQVVIDGIDDDEVLLEMFLDRRV